MPSLQREGLLPSCACILLYCPGKALTIIREPSSPVPDPQELALAALGWVLAEGGRADRFLALTGLTPDSLRAGLGSGEAGQRAVLAGVLDFLCAHEPDLVAAAQALDVPPQVLAAAREKLG